MNSAERYRELVRASEEDQRRLAAEARAAAGHDRWRPGAARFREDPFRENEALALLYGYIDPDDVVLDIGGGAGRYLPLARRCGELVNVEPSSGMGEQFELSAREAGIKNARWLHSDWLGAEIEGDVCFSANVVYYIADIVPFVEKLDAAGRRRVMIVMHSVPPVNVGNGLFHCVHGYERPLDPGHRELLPVLWDMGLLPEVRLLGPSDFIAERERYQSREEAIAAAVPASFTDERAATAAEALAARFEEFFVPAETGGFRRRPNGVSQVLLITWETTRDRS